MSNHRSKKFLVIVIGFSLIASNQLDAMKRLHEESTEISDEINPKRQNSQIVNNIVIRISSNKVFHKFSSKQIEIVETTIEGFKDDQVILSKKDNQSLLANSYPIQNHKQLKYLNENDKLIILRYDYNQSNYVEVALDEVVKKRILQYLLHDFSNERRNCFNFVNETVFALSGDNMDQSIFMDESIFSYDLLVGDDTYLKPGNAITLLQGNGHSLCSQHYALCLGNSLYLSKMGCGSPLFVTTSEMLKQNYSCNEIGILTSQPLPQSSFATIGRGTYSPHNRDSILSIRLIQQFFEDILLLEHDKKLVAKPTDNIAIEPQKINVNTIKEYIMSLYCNCFDQGVPEKIATLIRQARRVFRFNTQETIRIIKSYMKSKNLSSLDDSDLSALRIAIKNADLDTLRIICLLEGDDFNRLMQILEYLGKICNWGSISKNIIEYIPNLSHKLMKLRDKDGQTIFFSHNDKNVQKFCLNFLKKNPLNPMDILTLQDNLGHTLVHQEYDLDILSLIVDIAGNGSSDLFFIKNKNGETALHSAASICHFNTIDFLLNKAGSRAKELILSQTHQGLNAKDYLEKYMKNYTNYQDAEVYKKIKLTKSLLEKYLEQDFCLDDYLPDIKELLLKPTTLEGHDKSVNSVYFSPDGTILASGSDDKTIKLWNVATGEYITTLKGHNGPINSVSFSPNETILASGSDDNTIKLWEKFNGNWMCIDTLRGHTIFSDSVRFSNDGKVLACGAGDRIIKLLEKTNGKWECITTLEVHNSLAFSVSFNPNGKILASGLYDNTIRLWNVLTGENIATFEGHNDFVCSVCFSPDGKILASGSSDKTIKLWSVVSGKCIATFNGHDKIIKSLSFSPDGKILASGSSDKTIKLWNIRAYVQ